VRDLLCCCFACANNIVFLVSVARVKKKADSKRHGSREASAEQVPHPARPPHAGYEGFGMGSRGGITLEQDGK